MTDKETLLQNHSRTLDLHSEILLTARPSSTPSGFQVEITEPQAIQLEALSVERKTLLEKIFPPAPAPARAPLRKRFTSNDRRYFEDEHGNRFEDAAGKIPFDPNAPVVL